MRFRRLELGKFGAFTGEVLDFGDERPDFHVIFGPNEAGKSTTLRAIKGFLYGIPHVSRDVYLHSGGDLRITADLQANSEVKRLTRRKGRKATLLDGSGEPVAEEQLKAVLKGVDSEIYSALFGLDHVSLREGGSALARGEGQLGESLYAAGIGSGGVREVISKLRAEAEALYLPRGKRTINQLVTRYQDAKSQLRLATTEPEGWLKQRDEVNRQQAEVEGQSARRNELRLEESRLNQLQRLGHIAARYGVALRELEGLGEPLALPQTFQEERERWMLQRTTSERDALRKGAEIESARQELGRLGEPGPLAREFEPSELEYLDNALGSHRKAVVDLPRRRGELQAIEAEIRQAMTSLELPTDDLLEPSLPGGALRARLADLIEQRARLEVTLQQQRDDLSELDARLENLNSRLAARPEPPEPARLEHALEVASAEQSVEARLQELTEQNRKLEIELAEVRRRLGVERLVDLELPTRDRVERFLKEQRSEERAVTASEEELARVANELQQIHRQLTSLESAGRLLQPEELTGARIQREAAWARVDDALRAGNLPAAAELRAFEAALRRVDSLADLLLGDAERVSVGAQLRRTAALLERAQVEAQERLSQHHERALAQRAEFGGAYPALADIESDALGPRFEALLRAREIEERLDSGRREVARLQGRLSAAMADLRERLLEYQTKSEAQSLAELIAVSRGLLARLGSELLERRADVSRGTELADQRAVRMRLLNQTEAEHGAWASRWERSLASLGLSPDTPSRVVNARLEAFAQLERRLDKRTSLRGRIQGMERDAAQLAEWLRERLERLSPDLIGWDVARAGAELKRRFHEERTKAERVALISTHLERLERELTESRRDAAEAERELGRLCEIAGVRDAGDLLAAERRAADQSRLRAAIQERQRELLEEAAGTWDGVPEILAAVREMAPAAIALRLSQLESDLAELDESYRDAISDLERKRAGLERLSTGSAATRREEQAEVLAALRREVVRYRRVKLAELILAQEVERYRKENQGPILERANQLFPALTLGRYRELAVGFDADDHAILEAIPSGARGDHERVRVDDLSDGARDQLYLALRIASIERYVEAGVALPVVLDDVLVHFDEERALAALQALAALAQRTQVLFFTHHRRHVELCEAALGARFTLHQLRRAAA